jgi:flagellar protein FlaG
MSSETFTTALFLITSIIAAGVLINAIFPVVYTMAGTFASSSHDSDQRMRTDFRVVTTHCAIDGKATVWMKNIGSARLAAPEIAQSDLFFGKVGSFSRMTYNETPDVLNGWNYQVEDDTNGYWDQGETLRVDTKVTPVEMGEMMYFQFVLPDGVSRTEQFSVG